MNCNSTILSDPNSLSKDELVDEYDKLSIAYKNEKKSNERFKQTIHELKLNLQTAQNAESFLSTELDAIQSTQSTIIKDIIEKHQIELENLRKRYEEAKEFNLSQETDLATKRDIIEELKLQLLESSTKSNDSINRQSQSQFVEMLLKENDKLKAIQDEFIESENILREQLQSELIAKEQNKTKIFQLEEQCECLTETLATKRNELDEKNDLYEALQEKVCALSGELASLKNNADLGCKYLYIY